MSEVTEKLVRLSVLSTRNCVLTLSAMLFALGISESANAKAIITTFDVPGDIGGTFVRGINAEGAVTGWYADVHNEDHSFVRAVDGTITTFDAAGSTSGT
jgi:predicted membrane protein